jgi:hypothetical protein
MPDQLPPVIINQHSFNQASASWLEVISQPDTAGLQNSFKQGDLLITGVGFSTTQIAQLVATIGVVHIKARFILQSPAPGTMPQFSLALFATDSLDARVSSYYVPQVVYTDTASFIQPSNPSALPLHKNQLHYVLAERWRQSWASLVQVKPEYFATPYGPLRGYTFGLSEFTAMFLLLKTLGDEMLKISFVLHDYYQPDPSTSGDQLAHTFALALSLKRPDDTSDPDDPQDIGNPIINNGMPCPPQC